MPKLPERVEPKDLGAAVPPLDVSAYDFALAGSPYRWGDYEVGEKIDHVDGMTLEEAEHQIATRLYQNTAKVHFNQHTESKGRFGKRIVYGGVVISLARALSFNGLATPSISPPSTAAGMSRPLRWRYGLCLVRNSREGRASRPHGHRRAAHPPRRREEPGLRALPLKKENGEYAEGVILDLDTWLVLPR